MIAVGLVRAYLARGSYHGLYYSIEKPLKFFQTGAVLEVIIGPKVLPPPPTSSPGHWDKVYQTVESTTVLVLIWLWYAAD